MTEFEAEINTLQGDMENFLRTVARKEPSPSQPIYLRIEYKNSLKLSDRSKTSYRVEESYLSAFRDIYTDKSCTSLLIQSRPSVFTIGNLNSTSKAKGAKKSHCFPIQ